MTDSHSTGLTLPGMIDDPACSSGSRSSPRPAAGPLASSRMSLAIFVSATATARRPLDASPSAPWPPWCTIGFGVVRSGKPGLGGQRPDDRGGEAVGCIDPGADGGAAERELSEGGDVRDRTVERAFEQAGPRVGLLTHRDGCRVHQVRAPGLHRGRGAFAERLQ